MNISELFLDTFTITYDFYQYVIQYIEETEFIY
jgi:hypothetical protein